MPLGKLRFYIDRFTRSIWFLPIAHAVGALIVLFAAHALAPFVPAQLERLVGDDATAEILTILASSLLAVAIFGIGSLVAALNTASAAATPRARRLISGDRVAQTTISIFIGTFIFSILALLGISTGYYEGPARVILLFCTLFVIATVVVSLVSWIDQISRLGSVEEAINMVARAAKNGFHADATVPLMGGRALRDVPDDAVPIAMSSVGFVQLVDGEALGAISDEHEIDLYVTVRPGDHVGPDQPVAHAGAGLDDAALKEIRAAFVIGDRRSFDADPRYGLTVLSEIASRALSPGVNDPGTAIDVIATLVRVLLGWREASRDADDEVRFTRLYVTPFDPGVFLSAAFRWIARDGAALLEVQSQLQTALGVLAGYDPDAFAEPARRLSAEAIERAGAALLPSELAELRRVASRAFDQSRAPEA